MKFRRSVNPFYVLLVIAGVLFVVTASAYGVMTLRMIEPADRAAMEGHGMVAWMNQHGFTALMVELGVLAVATVAAISTDRWWSGEISPRAGGLLVAADDPTDERDRPPAGPDAGGRGMHLPGTNPKL